MRGKQDDDLGKQIRKMRKQRGMTQERLAKLLQVDRTYICAIETGRRYPSWKLLAELSEVLELDLYGCFLSMTHH